MQTLIYHQQKQIRMQGTPDDPLFCAKDICEMCGISNWRDALNRVPDDEKGVGITDTLGGKQKLIFVNEPGLYRLIFMSRKPEAEAFKNWVFKEVLPSIRKTGSYHANRADLPFDLQNLPLQRRDVVTIWLDVCAEMTASNHRHVTAKEIQARFGRGFNYRTIYKKFKKYSDSGGDWKVLDRYRSLYKLCA